MGLEDLANQIAGEVHILPAYRKHGTKIGGVDRPNQVENGTLLQEAGSKPGKGSEQKRWLTIDNASVQVRNGHGGRTDRRLAVDLGVVLLHDLLFLADQPLTANREATVALGLDRKS